LQYSKPQVNVLVTETKTRPQTFETETWKMGSLKTKTKSRDHHCPTCSGEINILCSKCNVHLCLNQWWSLETHFCEAWSRRFKVSSQSQSQRLQVSRLCILQRNRLVKFLKFNAFSFVVFAGKKQPQHARNKK